MSLRNKIIKKVVARQLAGFSEGSITEQRQRQERRVRLPKLPAKIQCQPVHLDGLPGEWIAAGDAADRVILYLHGGAYALGSINIHREWIARLAFHTQARALAINYRLAPEHPYPAALQDTDAAYHWLLGQGIDPAQIILAGDSAGGGLALAALVSLRDRGEALPAGAVLISPWIDLALSGPSMQEKAKADPILDARTLSMYAAYYAGENDLRSPLISPLYADLRGLPPLLIQVGADEVLLDDARRLAARAREAGVDVTCRVWEEMFHVFQMLPFMPETKEAVGQIVQFVSNISQ